MLCGTWVEAYAPGGEAGVRKKRIEDAATNIAKWGESAQVSAELIAYCSTAFGPA